MSMPSISSFKMKHPPEKSDNIVDIMMNHHDQVINYPIEFLNSLDLPGMLAYVSTLKIGALAILLH